MRQCNLGERRVNHNFHLFLIFSRRANSPEKWGEVLCDASTTQKITYNGISLQTKDVRTLSLFSRPIGRFLRTGGCLGIHSIGGIACELRGGSCNETTNPRRGVTHIGQDRPCHRGPGHGGAGPDPGSRSWSKLRRHPFRVAAPLRGAGLQACGKKAGHEREPGSGPAPP